MQEYEVDKNRVAIFPNYITNRHYRFAQNMLAIVNKSASALNGKKANRSDFLKPIELNKINPQFLASAEFVYPSVA